MDRLTGVVEREKKLPFMHSHDDCMMHFLVTISVIYGYTNCILADMSWLMHVTKLLYQLNVIREFSVNFVRFNIEI